MKYPPRYPYRIRPPFEVIPSPSRHLLAVGLLLAGLAIAVLGAFHDVQSSARKPIAHAAVASPPPAGGSFQALVDPKPAPAEPSLTPAEPAPTAVPQLRQSEVVPTPLVPLYAAKQGNPTIPPPVQVWSSSAVLTPVALPAVVSTAPVGPVVAAVAVAPVLPQTVQADPTATQVPSAAPIVPSTPAPVPNSTPVPTPTLTPTPRPSTAPTPQPSPTAGSPGCVPTRRHPCPPRGENR